jgi:hypothetical protein
VFPDDLKEVGDIQQLEGRMVEIKGTIQDHDGRAEIVLQGGPISIEDRGEPQ